MSFLFGRSASHSVICLGHGMICHDPKTTRDCSVSKTTTNNMISFPFLFRYFIYRGKTTITKIYFGQAGAATKNRKKITFA